MLKQLCINQQNTADFPVTWSKDSRLGGDENNEDDNVNEGTLSTPPF
jgi:hypothetical protein